MTTPNPLPPPSGGTELVLWRLEGLEAKLDDYFGKDGEVAKIRERLTKLEIAHERLKTIGSVLMLVWMVVAKWIPNPFQ
jgi:hypothetical protein